jgi:hypothetical protein
MVTTNTVQNQLSVRKMCDQFSKFKFVMIFSLIKMRHLHVNNNWMVGLTDWKILHICPRYENQNHRPQNNVDKLNGSNLMNIRWLPINCKIHYFKNTLKMKCIYLVHICQYEFFLCIWISKFAQRFFSSISSRFIGEYLSANYNGITNLPDAGQFY